MNHSITRRSTVALMLAAAAAPRSLMPAIASDTGSKAGAAPYTPEPNGEVDGLRARFIDVAGQRTRYYDYGQGEAVLLIHGGGRGTTSSANNFSPIIPLLAKNYRVIAFDKSAAGMTDNPRDDKDLSYEGEVRHAYALIGVLNLGTVHVVGHSSGGAVAFYLAVEHPEVVKTLTIVAHGPEMPALARATKHDIAEKEQCKDSQLTYSGRACRLRLLGHTPQTWDEAALVADAWMADRPKSKVAREKYSTTRAAALPTGELTLAYRNQMWDKVRRDGLRMPVMMVSGKQDTLAWEVGDAFAMMRSELEMFDVLGSNRGRVKWVVMNEAGHFPYREHPRLFAAEVDNFIRFWLSF